MERFRNGSFEVDVYDWSGAERLRPPSCRSRTGGCERKRRRCCERRHRARESIRRGKVEHVHGLNHHHLEHEAHGAWATHGNAPHMRASWTSIY